MMDDSVGREGEKVRVGRIFDRNVRGLTAVVSMLLAVLDGLGTGEAVIFIDAVEEGMEGLLVGERT